MNQTSSVLMRHLAAHGWLGRIVPIEHLSDLEYAIQGTQQRGCFDDEFYRERLRGFSFRSSQGLVNCRSIIVLAHPVPQVQTVFHWKGERFRAILPPTYAGYGATSERVRASVGSLLGEEGYRVETAELPLKTLAVCSGLAQYGKNNISYLPGLGSFFQLVGVLSDLPCPEDAWDKPRMMERCGNCEACLRACPTGAIGRDRFLLHAERCITFHNERRGEFPAWLNPAWHNCLFGCMRCQDVCPENKAVLSWIEEKEEFAEEETRLLMEYAPVAELPAGTVEKLRRLDLFDDLPILSRNLLVLLGGKRVPS
jgi:epoxyqueuosine reductase